MRYMNITPVVERWAHFEGGMQGYKNSDYSWLMFTALIAGMLVYFMSTV